MSVKVSVIDYGSGNMHSVVKALRECGADVQVTAHPDDVRHAERLVLPGVGAFADGMGGLRRRGLDDAVREFCASGRPFLGICLGMQMLLERSSEFGSHGGLGIIPGEVVEIPRQPTFKVPHIGWSQIQPSAAGIWRGSMLEATPAGTRVYFVHSYSAVPRDEADRLADTDFGGFRISAAVRRGGVCGCQFHPEKSGPAGLVMVKKFLQLPSS